MMNVTYKGKLYTVWNAADIRALISFIERSEMRARAKARVRPGERRPMRFSVQHGTPGWREDEEVDAMVIRNLRGQR